MKRHILLVTFLAFLTICEAQESCHVEGECLLGGFVGNTNTADYNECLEFCQTTPDCTDFTFYEDTSVCAALTSCPVFSNITCVNCFSGQRDCPIFQDIQCGIQGECNGALLHIENGRNDENDCIEMCLEYDLCSYYTYTKSIQQCAALATCDQLFNTNNPDYVSGERLCGNTTPADSYSTLMIVGGELAIYDVEVIDLSGNERNCFKPSDYPIAMGSTGIFFDGMPTVCGGEEPVTSSCYKYSYQNDSWLPGLEMIEERANDASSFLSLDEWWITGGYSSEILYSGQDSFQSYVDLPEFSSYHTMVRINESLVALVDEEIYIFDKRTQNFTELPSLMNPRYDSQAGAIEHSNGTINLVITGGDKGDYTISSTEIFDFDTMSWSSGPDLPHPWQSGKSVQFKNTFLVIGGFNANGISDYIYEFDVESMKWITRKERLTTKRENFAVFLVPDCEETNFFNMLLSHYITPYHSKVKRWFFTLASSLFE